MTVNGKQLVYLPYSYEVNDMALDGLKESVKK